MEQKWKDVAIAPAAILLPAPTVALSAWAVVACDQYTSQPEYWRSVEEAVGDQPSTLRITLPEIHLGQSDTRVPAIHKAMKSYLEKGILREAVSNGFVLTERTTDSGSRLGLVAAVDLDSYDFDKGSRSMVRATEGTILSRIPPRLKVRENAPLESPHVLLLLDDIQKTVIEPLHALRYTLAPLYDVDLMVSGGHLRGWAVTEPAHLDGVYAALKALKHKLPEDNPLLMAVGDGNHSLATAKTHWENVKGSLSTNEAQSHPARFALVEIENIHDEALHFHPIHRVVFNAEGDALLKAWAAYCAERGMALSDVEPVPGGHIFTVLFCGQEKKVAVHHPQSSLPVGTLQKFLDDYLSCHPEAEIDYIHGDDTVKSLCRQPKTVGFLVPGLDKSALLPAVRQDGSLPRKTFSMGEAHEKRYYMECRKIL